MDRINWAPWFGLAVLSGFFAWFLVGDQPAIEEKSRDRSQPPVDHVTVEWDEVPGAKIYRLFWRGAHEETWNVYETTDTVWEHDFGRGAWTVYVQTVDVTDRVSANSDLLGLIIRTDGSRDPIEFELRMQE